MAAGSEGPPPAEVRRASGNVLRLFDGRRMIIDFSPYLRPAAYAEAIIAVDALLWYDAPFDIVEHLDPVDRGQMLLRAALFRALCDGIFFRDNPMPRTAEDLAGYDRVLDAIAASG